eukprot:4306142-Pyramimonas_sp.AAC.1
MKHEEDTSGAIEIWMSAARGCALVLEKLEEQLRAKRQCHEIWGTRDLESPVISRGQPLEKETDHRSDMQGASGHQISMSQPLPKEPNDDKKYRCMSSWNVLQGSAKHAGGPIAF